MAETSANISIRMDPGLKSQAGALFAELGMNLSAAISLPLFAGRCAKAGFPLKSL